MKVLISIKDKLEAEAVSNVKGIDIIDIKNPLEGTLGANHPWVIEEIKKILPSSVKVGASIGDLDFKPGSASLAAYGTASLDVDFITASMFNVKTAEEVKILTEKILKAVEGLDTGLIVAGYADADRCSSISPFEFLHGIEGAEYIMIDTAIKDGKSILDFATLKELQDFKEEAHDLGLKLIVAGSIRYSQLPMAKKIQPDALGFRGIVCKNGAVEKELVQRLVRNF